MPVEVSCPNCKCRLQAPDEMAGRKARCKRCRASFRVPGGAPAGDSDGDSVQLSGSDFTPPAATATAEANPFAFDDAPPPRAIDRPTPPPAASLSRPEAAGENPFALPAPGQPVQRGPAVEAKARPSDKSTPKYRPKAAPADGDAASDRPAGGSRRVIAVAGLVGVLCAAGGGAGVYFWMRPKAPQTSPTPATAEKAPPPAPKPNGKAAPAPPPEKAEAVRTSDRRAAKSEVRVTGGLALPPGPAGAGTVIQKPKDRVPLEVEAGKVRRLLPAGADAGMVAVVWPLSPGLRGAGAVDAVDRYSLAGGRRLDRLELPADGLPWPRACDLSPDGNRFASEFPAGKLTVWNLGDKAKLLDGVDPYKDAGQDPPPGIAAVYFVDGDALAVVSQFGAVDVWDLKAKAKKVTGTPIEAATPDRPPADRRTVAVTPDRKAVLVLAGGVVYQVPTDTGKPKAALTLPRTPDAGYALAADASGSRVVAAYRAADPAPHTVVVVARLGAEKPAMVVHLSDEAGVPVAADWPGPETAVVVTDAGAGLVIDGETNKVAAAVRAAVQQPGATTGLHWCVLPDPANAKKSVLVSVPLPFEGYFPLRDAAGDRPVGLAVGAEGLGK